MVCSQCLGADTFFNEKLAKRELKRYRRKGPMPSTRQLIEALKSRTVKGLSLLDIGGGIGAIQLELLKAGVMRTLDIDAASDYLTLARAEAQRQGFAKQVAYRKGDFVEIADDIGNADIVTLDRVICCYPDMPKLVDLSAQKAKKLYGLVFPRDTWRMRIALPLINLYQKIRRCPMRMYLHSPLEIDRLVREQGFVPHHESRTFLWQVVVYERAG